MTAPVWMAFPPEVHSALLSSGPGPGSLLAAAVAWGSLGTEYATVADELSATVAAVQAGVWEGSSAESYVAANAPYVAWLRENSASSTDLAARHVAAATAYTAALAVMPTLGELAANHATHAVLMSTNFFGVNTIPIAVNEADYARMWVQASTTMTTYQAVSTAAVAAAPPATPAPQIEKAAAVAAKRTGPPPPLPSWLQELLKWLGYTPPTKVPLPVNPGQYPTLSGSFLSNILNDLNITAGEFTIHPGETLGQEVGQQLFFFWYTTTYLLPADLQAIAHGNLSQIFSLNTIAVLFSYVIMRIGNILAVVNYLALEPQYLIPLLPAFAPLATVGLTGFAGLSALAQHAAALPALVPAVAAVVPPLTLAPVLSAAPSPVSVLATTPATVPTAVPAIAPPPPPPAPAPPPPVSPGAEGFGYMLGNFAMGLRARDRAKTDEPLYRSGSKAPTLPTPADTREPVRARRRRAKVKELGRGYEYMDLDQELLTASDHGAGALGFAGTAHREAAATASGLTTIGGDAYGGGPTVPMMPHTWEGQDDA